MKGIHLKYWKMKMLVYGVRQKANLLENSK